MRSTTPHLARAVTAVLLPGLLAFLVLGVASPTRADAASATPRAGISIVPSAALASAAPPARQARQRSVRPIRGWWVAPQRVGAGRPFVAHLKVTGGRRPIRLQRKIGGAWRTVAAARSYRTGRVSLRWGTPHKTTRVALRVQAPRAGQRRPAATRVRMIQVRTAVRAAPRSALSPELARVLTLINDTRASGYTCGDTWYPAVPRLAHNARLSTAADQYARLMATRDFFSHTGPDGSSAGDRIDAAGYRWRSYGENLAAGHTSAEQVVQGWLDSTGHCQNLMSGFADIGLGHAYDADSTYGHYWVKELGTR